MCCPGKLLAQTDFSQVFVLSDEPNLVMKQARRDRPGGGRYLAHELNMYNHLRGITGVPRLLMFDESPEGSYFVMDRGIDLSTAGAEWPKFGKGYLNNLVASFTVSALAILANVHGRQVIHGDIKPANFIITNNGLHLIDFGSSILAKNPAVREPHPELPYTSSFASPQRLFTAEVCWVDDLISLAYTAISLLRGGSLPWDEYDEPDPCADVYASHFTRLLFTPSDLCRGLPAVYRDFLTCVLDLEPDKQFDYFTYISFFLKLLPQDL